jgi:hypothetical protein
LTVLGQKPVRDKSVISVLGDSFVFDFVRYVSFFCLLGRRSPLSDVDQARRLAPNSTPAHLSGARSGEMASMFDN